MRFSEKNNLVIDISSHGYGHVTQIAPVVRELARLQPELSFIVRSRLPSKIISESLGVPFSAAAPGPDFGMIMRNSYHVDFERSLNGYLEITSNLEAIADYQASALVDLGATAILSDIDFTGLAGAHRAGIPSIGLSSLHWAEVAECYFGSDPRSASIVSTIADTYDLCDQFILAGPRSRLPRLAHVFRVGVLARHWANDVRLVLKEQLQVDPNMRLGLISFGGVATDYSGVQIPSAENWFWIIGGESPNSRRDIISIKALKEFAFLDILASSDLVLTKTGYGTFAECAYYNVPCMFLSRPDWPEAPYLEKWITDLGIGCAVSFDDLEDGAWFERAQWHIDSRGADSYPLGLEDLGHRAAAKQILLTLDA